MIGQGEEGGEAQGEDASMSEIFVRGIAAGASGYLSDGLESFYTWVQSTNIPTDSAKLRNQYTAKYGFFGGEKELYNELMGMCEEGLFPNESMNESVKRFLEDGGNPYLLGIDPSELGWAAERSNSMEDFKEVQDEWMKGLSEAEQNIYKAGSWLGENVPNILLENLFINPALKTLGAGEACADILTPLLSSGGRWYNDGYTKSADEAYGFVDRNIVAVTNMLGSWIGNCETKSSDMLKAAYSTAIAQLSTPDITRLCSSVADLYQKIPEDTKKQ